MRETKKNGNNLVKIRIVIFFPRKKNLGGGKTQKNQQCIKWFSHLLACMYVVPLSFCIQEKNM